MNNKQQHKLKMKNDPLARAMANISLAEMGYISKPKVTLPTVRNNPAIQGYVVAPPQQLTLWQRFTQAIRGWMPVKNK